MDSNILAVLVIFLTNFKICQSRMTYDNFSLISVIPTELEHLKFLQNIEKQKYMDLHFWKQPYKLYEDVQFIVNPVDRDLFVERAKHYSMKVNVHLENVQQAFDNQTIHRYQILRLESFDFNTFHSLKDIYQWLSDIVLKFPHIAQLDSIGKTVEGRDIYALGINKAGAHQTVIVEGGIHGNEWLSVEFVTYLASQLLYSNPKPKTPLGDILRKYVWFLIPVVNPDGFEYSHTTDRLWRKNRRNDENGNGVDLNRNFDYNFCKFGTSNDTKSDRYCGPAPFSEPESKALADFIELKKRHLTYYFSVHAYGQKLIIPFSDRVKHVNNFNTARNYGRQAIMKMRHMNGVKYSIGTTYDTLGYRVSGNAASWVKKTYNVRYVFTFLLRDNGTYGYALPPQQILPACREALAGLVEIMTSQPKRVKLDLFNPKSLAPTISGNLVVFLLVFIVFVFK